MGNRDYCVEGGVRSPASPHGYADSSK